MCVGAIASAVFIATRARDVIPAMGVSTLLAAAWGIATLGRAAIRSAKAARKTCPDRGEQIRSAARVCRYCGFRYPTADRMSP